VSPPALRPAASEGGRILEARGAGVRRPRPVQPFRVFQVVWPDKDGRFPGEPGFREELKERQRLLP